MRISYSSGSVHEQHIYWLPSCFASLKLEPTAIGGRFKHHIEVMGQTRRCINLAFKLLGQVQGMYAWMALRHWWPQICKIHFKLVMMQCQPSRQARKLLLCRASAEAFMIVWSYVGPVDQVHADEPHRAHRLLEETVRHKAIKGEGSKNVYPVCSSAHTRIYQETKTCQTCKIITFRPALCLQWPVAGWQCEPSWPVWHFQRGRTATNFSSAWHLMPNGHWVGFLDALMFWSTRRNHSTLKNRDVLGS